MVVSMVRGKKALVLTSRSPYPLNAGYRLRIHYLATLLARHYDVDLLTLEPIKTTPDVPVPFTHVYAFPISKVSFAFHAIQRWPLGWPLQVAGYFSRPVKTWVDMNVKKYDLIYVHHVRMAPYVADIEAFSILDYHDAISMHYLDGYKQAKGFWRLIYRLEGPRLATFEASMLRRFHGAFIVSSVDKDYLLSRVANTSHSPLEVLPMGVRPELLNYPKAGTEHPWIVLAGNMRYYPNRDAAIFFATRVFPLIKKRYPYMQFYIVGANPTPDVRRLSSLPGVYVTGYVDDPWAYVSRASVVVAPVRLGAGIQNKVLEAMALGKVVIGTARAFRGIDGGEPDKHFVVANTPFDMAESISRLIEDKYRRIEVGQEARRLIEERYTWEQIGIRLFSCLEAWA